ncbi:MAG: branched-chain amino acid ABC transporter permease [Candidatus Thorarchaeota archaeon]
MTLEAEATKIYAKKGFSGKVIGILLAGPILIIFLVGVFSIPEKMIFIFNIITPAVIFYIAALSLDLEIGSIGLPNFGKVGFLAIGAYFSTLMYRGGVDYILAVIITILVGGFFGWLVSIPTVKLRADYFAIMTIAGAEIIRLIVEQEQRYFFPPNDLGTPQAIVTNTIISQIQSLDFFGIPLSREIHISLPGIDINQLIFHLNFKIVTIDFGSIGVWAILFFSIILFFAFLIYFFVEIIRKSPYGRTLRAIREDDITVMSVGKDASKYRWQITVISAMICTFSGCIWAIYTGTFEAIDFLPLVTFTLFAYVIIGGLGNSKGVAAGTLLTFTFLASAQAPGVKNFLVINIGPDSVLAFPTIVIPFTSISLSLPTINIGPIFDVLQTHFYLDADNSRLLILGVILILFLLYKPDGLIPEPKTDNKKYMNLLSEEEKEKYDKAIESRQRLSEKQRIEKENNNSNNELKENT